MGLFKRMKEIEQKIDAICQSEGITLEKQPGWRASKSKGEIGFRVKDGSDHGVK